MITKILKFYLHQRAKKGATDPHGTLIINGLREGVEVVRDRFGVPHIFAKNRHDLMFAQGYVHAQDRLWQMDLTRRAAKGRLCEIIGKDALPADRISRTLGFERAGKTDFEHFQNDQELMGLCESYVKGINAYLATHRRKLPLEIKLLKYKPEPWTVTDVFTFGRFISFQMSFGWLHEIVRMQISAAVGEDRLAELNPEYPAHNPVVLNKPGETNFVLDDGRLSAFEGPWLKPGGGSNNWTVAASKMDTGAPVLCNDPHLVLSMPNIWYENHLVCPDFESTGVSLPGSPMVMIGHNRNIAWGATLSFADIQDVYIEKFTDDSLSKYYFKNEILDAKIIEETIKIKGEKNPHVERVVYTHHGPIVSGIADCPEKQLALRSKALEPGEMVKGFFLLNVAKNWNDFVGAVKCLTAPALNLVYADVDKNIGYYMTSQVPIRNLPKGLTPSPGWTGEHEWTGDVPFEEMPHSYNPECGYLFSCNNKVVADDFPYFMGRNYMNGYRAARLKQLFESQDTYSKKDFAKWQMDFTCIAGLETAALFRKEMPNGLSEKLSPAAAKALGALLEWDGVLDAKSVGGCIYQVMSKELYEAVVGKPLGERLSNNLRGKGPFVIGLKFTDFMDFETVAVINLLNNPQSSWVKNAGGLHAVMAAALEKAVAYLTQAIGPDQNGWEWGKIHTIIFGHAFGQRKRLDRIFNRGPFPLGGDTNTLCQTKATDAYGPEITAASYRQIIDMGNLSRSRCVMPIGQSGSIASAHYDDQMQMWLDGEYRLMLWDKDEIMAQGTVLSLKPDGVK